MPTSIYIIADGYLGESYAFPTLAEAKRFRINNYDLGDRPEICKETLVELPKRELLCAMYNRRQFSTGTEVVVPGNEATTR